MKESKQDMSKSEKKPRKTKGVRPDSVIRISKENHLRLKALIRPVAGSKASGATSGHESTNECLERLLDASETLLNAEPLYVVGDAKGHVNIYSNLEDARGEAIMNAARLREPVKWPSVAVIIGEDSV